MGESETGSPLSDDEGEVTRTVKSRRRKQNNRRRGKGRGRGKVQKVTGPSSSLSPPTSPPPSSSLKRRRSKSGQQPSPESTDQQDSTQAEPLTELQFAHRLFQAVSTLPKVGPFWDKPDEFMFGMSNYYNVIKKPMWLAEIQRKLNCEVYKSISELVSDIHLMLENCLKFWGPTHRLTNLALTLENKIKSAIESLPSDVQMKCREGLIKEEPMEFSGIMLEGSNDSNDSNQDLANGSCQETTTKNIKDDHDVKVDEETLLLWENTLVTDEIKSQISTLWQLPALGMFLRVAYETLNINEIRQYELERMLLMPKESITLSTLLTSILSPPSLRSCLDATVPLMPYEVWNKKLHAKVQEWCDIYNKSNKMEALMTCGIEPMFWSAMDFSNPYSGDFLDLTFYQRVLILKALCDNVYHSEKRIQELFLDEIDCDSSSSDFQLGSLNNYLYFFVPCWPDVRVYKQKIITKSMWDEIKDDIGICTKLLLKIAVGSTPSEEEDGGDLEKVLRDFKLVAECEKGVMTLAERGSSAMAVRIASLGREACKHKPSLRTSQIRASLHHQFNTKLPAVEYENRRQYWEKRDRRIGLQTDLFIEGKRQRKERLLPFLSDDSDSEDLFLGFQCSDEEASGSDWEPDEKKKKSAVKRDEPKEDKAKKSKKKKKDEKKQSVKEIDKKEIPVANIKIEKDIDDETAVKKVPSIVTVQSLNENATNTKNVPPNLIQSDSAKDFSAVHQKFIVKEEVKVPKQEIIEEQKSTSKPDVQEKQPVKGSISQDIIDLSSDDDEPIITPVTTPIKPVGRTPLTPRTPLAVLGLSPRGVSPRGVTPQISPRNLTRTPIPSPRFSPSVTQQRYRTPSPRLPAIRQGSPRTPTVVAARPAAQRSLFGNSPARNTATTPTKSPAKPPPPGTIPCKILVGRRENGSFGYIARLEDGGVFDITPDEVTDIRMRNNGGIPSVVYLPRGRLGF